MSKDCTPTLPWFASVNATPWLYLIGFVLPQIFFISFCEQDFPFVVTPLSTHHAMRHHIIVVLQLLCGVATPLRGWLALVWRPKIFWHTRINSTDLTLVYFQLDFVLGVRGSHGLTTTLTCTYDVIWSTLYVFDPRNNFTIIGWQSKKVALDDGTLANSLLKLIFQLPNLPKIVGYQQSLPSSKKDYGLFISYSIMLQRFFILIFKVKTYILQPRPLIFLCCNPCSCVPLKHKMPIACKGSLISHPNILSHNTSLVLA